MDRQHPIILTPTGEVFSSLPLDLYANLAVVYLIIGGRNEAYRSNRSLAALSSYPSHQQRTPSIFL